MNSRVLAAELAKLAHTKFGVSDRAVALASAQSGDVTVNVLRGVAAAMIDAGVDGEAIASAVSAAKDAKVVHQAALGKTVSMAELVDEVNRLCSDPNVPQWIVDWYAGFVRRLAVDAVTSRDVAVLWIITDRR